jgi:predicted membrane channel-forming protein YqfA (hemolysin III family)
MATKKKVTKVGDVESPSTPGGGKVFEASPESKGKAKQLRLFAFLAWILAMAGQILAILKLLSDEYLVWLIVAIVVILALAITGSYLWKKANRLDPASEKQKVKFFIQNQLGAIMGVLAFLPLVILIFTNKNLSKQTKGIAGTIGVVALLVAGITGVDFNPASIEQYTEQTKEIELLNDGFNNVYWTPSGTRYHIYSDCSYINTDRTSEIFEGTVASARELKNITELCSRCRDRRLREKGMTEEDLQSRLTEELSDALEE